MKMFVLLSNHRKKMRLNETIVKEKCSMIERKFTALWIIIKHWEDNTRRIAKTKKEYMQKHEFQNNLLLDTMRSISLIPKKIN